MSHIKTLKFSINNWQHLYSLQQAVEHNNQLTGKTLNIKGKVVNLDFLNYQDTAISISFTQFDKTPDYPRKVIPGNASSTPVLGLITLNKQQLSTDILVDKNVFEELRKNLMEYADIEGIHIVVTLGLLYDSSHWSEGQSFEIIQLDYAMKGDA